MNPCISIKNLTKTFKSGFLRKRSDVLRGVDLEVQTGEVYGFLGPNGAGKTTTIKLMLGLIFPTQGSVEIFGRKPTEVEYKKEVGYLPDSPYFYSYLTGEEFLDFYGQLFGLRYSERKKRIDFLLDLVGLTRARKVQLRKYSRGMLQRIGMAQAIINNPSLVIMDEPQSGLDPEGRKKIRDIILQLKSEGKTIFFSSHILSDVEMICDRVAIMVKGQIKGSGLLSDLLNTKINSVEICLNVKPDSNLSLLQEKFGTCSKRGDQVFLMIQQNQIDPLVEFVANQKMSLFSLIPNRESLEELFMSEIK